KDHEQVLREKCYPAPAAVDAIKSLVQCAIKIGAKLPEGMLAFHNLKALVPFAAMPGVVQPDHVNGQIRQIRADGYTEGPSIRTGLEVLGELYTADPALVPATMKEALRKANEFMQTWSRALLVGKVGAHILELMPALAKLSTDKLPSDVLEHVTDIRLKAAMQPYIEAAPTSGPTPPKPHGWFSSAVATLAA
ncbi:MAG: hypothetical protein EB059_09015, partial [Alphaproteobacteria bacterium]|nr:hypothetical protein [Alphaproteobacteria bacterium]